MQESITITKDGRIFLCLSGKDYKPKRLIGKMHPDGETLIIERDPYKHLFHKLNSYGFNYELISRGRYKTVCVSLGLGQNLFATKNYILAKGVFLDFEKNQLERQIFLSLSEFSRSKQEAIEKEQSLNLAAHKSNLQKAQEQQGGLFGGAQ